MLSALLTILFLTEAINSFKTDKVRVPKSETSHIRNLNWNLRKLTWSPPKDYQVKRILREFIAAVSPIRLPESVLNRWHQELLRTDFDIASLYDIMLSSIGRDGNKSTTINFVPKPFMKSPLDDITPLIDCEHKEELNKKYEYIADKLEPEYILTECFIAAILHEYNVKPEKKLTYDEEWKRYEEGIREGIIDQNIAENYYYPAISGAELKFRGLERYYRERVKAGADPLEEAKRIVDVMRNNEQTNKVDFDFDKLPSWTKDVSLALIRYFALKTDKTYYASMLSDISKESQVRRRSDFKDGKILNQYVDYCLTQTKPFRGTSAHISPRPFWYWRDVVLRMSPDEDSAIKEIVDQIKHDDPDADIEKMTEGTLVPCCSSDNPTREEIVISEYEKALKLHKNKNKPEPVKTTILPSPFPPKEFLEKALPGFTPPRHFAHYFRDALSQKKFDQELKKYNLEHFGTERYRIYNGQVLKGKIIGVEPKLAYVDINAHLTGELSIEEVFKDPKTVPLGGLTKVFKEGDEIYFEIIAIWPYSIKLSLVCLRELYKMKPILECYMGNKQMMFTVKDFYTKGLYGEVFGYKAFIPRNHLSYNYQDHIKLYRPGLEGTQIPVMYLDYDWENRVVLVSNCKSIEHEQVQFVKIGDILKCKPIKQTQYGLILKAGNVHCLLSLYDMSETHVKKFKLGFSSVDDVYAQVIGFERHRSGAHTVKLSSKDGIDLSIIPTNTHMRFTRGSGERRGINEFISDWRKYQLGIIKPVPMDQPMEPVSVEEESQEMQTGSFNMRSPSPSLEPVVHDIFRSNNDDFELESRRMDLEDEEYVKSNRVLRDFNERSMIWYVDTQDGLVELGPGEQRYLTNSYKQNDDVARYSIGKDEICADFREQTYYHSGYDEIYRLFLKKL